MVTYSLFTSREYKTLFSMVPRIGWNEKTFRIVYWKWIGLNSCKVYELWHLLTPSLLNLGICKWTVCVYMVNSTKYWTSFNRSFQADFQMSMSEVSNANSQTFMLKSALDTHAYMSLLLRGWGVFNAKMQNLIVCTIFCDL